jgi:predicted porin
MPYRLFSSKENYPMTKKLLALAVAGAFAAPFTASAADNVTIYGTLNLSIDFTKTRAATATPTNPLGETPGQTTQISCSSCNIGFRGEEDLGGGLAAWFQLESGIDPDERTGSLTSRNSAVGLKGGWGTFLIGNWDTPGKLNVNAYTPFYATTVGAYNMILGAQGGVGGFGPADGVAFDNRQTNSVQYWSPQFLGGLGVRLLYSTGGDSPTNGGVPGQPQTNDYVYGGSIVWDKGNLYAGVAYEKQQDSITSGFPPSLNDRDMWSVNVSYAFAGKYRVGAIYDQQTYNSLPGTLTPTLTSNSSVNQFMIFAVLPVGPGAFHAQYSNADDWDNRSDSGADGWSVGYYYDLSKRTKLYVQWAQVDNDSLATYKLGSGPGNRLQGAPGASVQAASLGVRHSF